MSRHPRDFLTGQSPSPSLPPSRSPGDSLTSTPSAYANFNDLRALNIPYRPSDKVDDLCVLLRDNSDISFQVPKAALQTVSVVFSEMFSTSALCASTTSRLPPDQSSPPIDLFVPTLVLRIFCDLATQQTLYSLKRPLSEPAVDTFTQLVNLLDRFQCAPALLERLMQHAQPVIACEPWEMFVIFARLDMVHEARECIRKFATASLPPQAQLRSRYRSNSLTKPHPHLPDCGSQSDWILPHCIPAEEANKIPVAWLLALFKARKSEELEHERQNRQNGGNGGGGGAQNRQRAAIIQPRAPKDIDWRFVARYFIVPKSLKRNSTADGQHLANDDDIKTVKRPKRSGVSFATMSEGSNCLTPRSSII